MDHEEARRKNVGGKKLQYNDAPEDIEPEEIRPMGNYAVSMTWPDGFTQWLIGTLLSYMENPRNYLLQIDT
ncbi:unnamed protein product [Camellia sinensis]